MTELTSFEKFTLDAHLVDYPSDASFDEIMDIISDNDEDDRIVIWTKLEAMNPDDLINVMKVFLEELKIRFGKVTIQVSGGVAYATKYPSGMEIHIQDHDNMTNDNENLSR